MDSSAYSLCACSDFMGVGKLYIITKLIVFGATTKILDSVQL